MAWTADSTKVTADATQYTADGGGIGPFAMINGGRILDVYDNGNGSLFLEWQQFAPSVPTSYNVYLNGVLNQNVADVRATVTGLHGATYLNGVITPPQTVVLRVAAVLAGVEIAATFDKKITVQPTSIMLTTPMKRIWPFPNAGLN